MRTFHWIVKCGILQFKPIMAYYTFKKDYKGLLSQKVDEAIVEELKRGKTNNHGR